MRFYTQRCALTHNVDTGAPIQSGRVGIIDGTTNVNTFYVHESDADFVCAALNAAAKQHELCSV